MAVIKTTLRLYLLIIGVFSICRLILLFNNLDLISTESGTAILTALVLGLRFDIVISGYILLPSFIYLSISGFLKRPNLFLEKILFVYLIIIPGLAILVSAADIPYFMQFFQHINAAIFLYYDEFSFVFSMIVGEFRYWMYAVLFVLLMLGYVFCLRYILKLHQKYDRKRINFIQVAILIPALVLILLGIRGRIEGKSPIRTGTASFTNNSFLNKLGLNANFTLINSTILKIRQGDTQINFMNRDAAMEIVIRQFGSKSIERRIEWDASGIKSNVILVIMESMSAVKMGRFGNTEELTPFLDSISSYGFSFDRTYTAGIHTFNGVFSTLYSLPSPYDYHPMKQSFNKSFTGLPTSLKELGYHTSFFTTHDGQFDNMEGFLYNNGFDDVTSLEDYPKDRSLSNLGVPDDYMFEFGLKKIDDISANHSNFLAVFLTASDHGPYIIPDYFNATAEETKKKIVQYADWSLRKLVDKASEYDWFENTYFVFIADHGSWDYAVYQMPLTYHHTPFIIYAPKLIDSAVAYSNLTAQIDLYPTLMGILKQPYMNKGLGVDARKVRREYVYFTGDDKLGIIDDAYFYYFDKEDSKFLYEYKNKNPENFASKKIKEVNKLDQYLKANYRISMELLVE